MEHGNILDINNDIHIFSLHFVFLPRIARDLEAWKEAHNNHPLRTEKNNTPVQLWLSGSITNLFLLQEEDRENIMANFMDNEIWNEPQNISHVLSRIPAPLSVDELNILKLNVNPLQYSRFNGVDLYGRVVNYIHECLQDV